MLENGYRGGRAGYTYKNELKRGESSAIPSSLVQLFKA